MTVNECLLFVLRDTLDASRPGRVQGSAAQAPPWLRRPTSGQAEATVRFGLDGTEHEIDLSAGHARALRQGLARYVSAAQRSRWQDPGSPARGGCRAPSERPGRPRLARRRRLTHMPMSVRRGCLCRSPPDTRCRASWWSHVGDDVPLAEVSNRRRRLGFQGHAEEHFLHTPHAEGSQGIHQGGDERGASQRIEPLLTQSTTSSAPLTNAMVAWGSSTSITSCE